MRRYLSLILGIWMTLAVSPPALAEKRVALVTGNSAYRSIAPLDNPKNDAKLIADTLAGLGFVLV